MPRYSTLDERLHGPGPKRVLSLDGGGVRGLVTLGILKQVETVLRRHYGDDQFVLADYFDLIGGTSTGALISTLLALGYDVDRIVALYHNSAPAIFRNKRWLKGVYSKFDTNALSRAVRANLSDFLLRSGRDPKDIDVLRLKTELMRTGFAVVSKRIDRGSVWILTNNPKAKFWDARSHVWRDHLGKQGIADFYPNSDYSLATLVQASASAPYYLDGVKLQISPTETGLFLDGGVSPFNNPCQELFLMTTLKDYDGGWNSHGVSPFGFKWETGADRYFMLSVGTGTWRPTVGIDEFQKWWAASKAVHALQTMIHDTSVHAQAWMQAISEPSRPQQINSNVLDMKGLRIVEKPLLHFRRVDAPLDRPGLEVLLGSKSGLDPGSLEAMRQLDNAKPANLKLLEKIGLAAGEREIGADDFPACFDVSAPVRAFT